MSGNGNPLGERGKAAEDKWAHEQNQAAIDKMKKQGQGDQTGDKSSGGCKGGADCKSKGGKGCGKPDCKCGQKAPAPAKDKDCGCGA